MPASKVAGVAAASIGKVAGKSKASISKVAGVTLAAPFTPTDLGATLKLWLRASSIAQADNTAVTGWTDDSGSGNTPVNATSSQQPTLQTNEINGLPVVRFDSGDVLIKTSSTVPSQASFTAFAVAKCQSTAASAVICSVTSSWRFGTSPSANKGRLTTPGIKDYDLTNAWPATNTAYIQTVVFDSSFGVSWWRDGTSLGTNTSGSNPSANTQFCVGGDDGSPNFPWTNDIAELIICNSNLSTANKNSVGAYLGALYGITWSTIP